jgi:ABC-type multidrug transport system fused ATPase/permease subunit
MVVMLEKDKGDPKIDRLGIICLYEADYNIFLKIMWAHRLVQICEDNELFDNTQTGGRPNRTSGDVAVRKMLTNSYSRVTRTPFACMDLDAKSCYDRIMASFGMLCLHYFGMPQNACILHGTTIAEMQHHDKTALGISSSFFQSTPERVLYGSGQGSSGSPPLWMAISIILFRTLEAQMGVGATYLCLWSTLTTNHTTKAFVNNSTNFINSATKENQDTVDQLKLKLHLQNEEWERILSTSGGKLELPKCLAYIVVYDWIKGEPQQ